MASKPVMLDIGTKAAERMGPKRLWSIPRSLRQLPSQLTVGDLRECLRDLGIFISDEPFAIIRTQYTTGGGGADGKNSNNNADGDDGAAVCDLDAFLSDFTAALLNPRRRYVVGLVTAKLDPEKTGLIQADRMWDCYDTLRHPLVVAGIRDGDDVLSEFFDGLSDDSGDYRDGVIITAEELACYYCGISVKTPSDEEFELRCIRSFSLDRPKFDDKDGAGRLAGSRAVSRQSRLLGLGRDHPLFTTTYSEYGSGSKDHPPSLPQHGLTQKFTRSQPGRSGGATFMNM